MHNLSLLEECYKKYSKNFYSLIPEGIYFVNLDLLHRFDLLHFQLSAEHKNPILTRYFHIMESPEKITLFNDEFVIWIMADKTEQVASTYTFIALDRGDQEPQLELAFIASGIYNSSKLVLQVLERFLIEIEETELFLSNLKEI